MYISPISHYNQNSEAQNADTHLRSVDIPECVFKLVRSYIIYMKDCRFPYTGEAIFDLTRKLVEENIEHNAELVNWIQPLFTRCGFDCVRTGNALGLSPSFVSYLFEKGIISNERSNGNSATRILSFFSWRHHDSPYTELGKKRH
mmetsp:Transcript_6172/g.23333  ORF Transcript_6172/g.23333 Transcript_6172/m.23333 type:complete len:145 (-) Transcript_6172:622-1056(-)